MTSPVSCSLLLLIVRQVNVYLTDHNWIYSLQLLTIFKSINHLLSINNVPKSESTVWNLLRKFKKIFALELGIVQDV